MRQVRRLLLVTAGAFVLPGVAIAQTTTAPQTGQVAQPPGTTNPAQPGMTSPRRPGDSAAAVQTDGAPTAGANSFTEGQARSRIEDAGYSQVTGLRLDDAGVWRGRATRGGAADDVALDFRGNVYAAAAARSAAARSAATGSGDDRGQPAAVTPQTTPAQPR